MTTQVGYGPNVTVDGPSPVAPKYGLVPSSVVKDDITADDIDRWINGVAVYPYPKDVAHAFDPCAPSSTKLDKSSFATAVPLPTFGAMTIFIAQSCNPASLFGAGMTEDEAQSRFVARGRAVFTAVESAAVEREFLSGELYPSNPHLADGTGTFPYGDVATTVVNGFAVLEDEIAASGRAGMIHASPSVITIAANNKLIQPDNNGVLRTINGNVVVSGTGYSRRYGTSVVHPSGHAAPGTALQDWIYATGMIDIRRSDIDLIPGTLAQAMNRGTNLVSFMSERYYVVDWDTEVHAAVLVDRCSSSCGTPPS